MTNSHTPPQYLLFGSDKSQILRGFAIVFMILLHNDIGGLFKICVPIFTFLVGYGYSFAKQKNIRHACVRSWHLLSHFWLILFTMFLPVAIWSSTFQPTYLNVFYEMFGLDSQLNWYSWYVYFYLFAMIAMIGISRLIDRFKLPAVIVLAISCLAIVFLIHQIPNWHKNVWILAIHDCFACSSPMFTGYYLAKFKIAKKIPVYRNMAGASVVILLAIVLFFIRILPLVWVIDFVTVPLFCLCIVYLFNIIRWERINSLFISLGKESMNMWFIHAAFATACTAAVYAPLIAWIDYKPLYIIAMIIVSYVLGRIYTALYGVIKVTAHDNKTIISVR